jgi:hypothetical protein
MIRNKKKCTTEHTENTEKIKNECIVLRPCVPWCHLCFVERIKTELFSLVSCHSCISWLILWGASRSLRLALEGDRRQLRLAELLVQRSEFLTAQRAPAVQERGKRLLRLAACRHDLAGRRRIRALQET